MSSLIIPLMVVGVIVYGVVKKIDIYDSFICGVGEAIKMLLSLFPVIFAMVIGIDLMVNSLLLSDLSEFLSPLLSFFHFPVEILPLAVLRPISGSSALVMMNDIFREFGVDSYVGRVASLVQGTTDTTIYIIGLYFSSVGIKKIRYALIVGLLADLCAIILSMVVVRLWFH